MQILAQLMSHRPCQTIQNGTVWSQLTQKEYNKMFGSHRPPAYLASHIPLAFLAWWPSVHRNMDGTKGQKYKKWSWRILYSTISLNSAWDITGLMKFWFYHILELLSHAKKKIP